jgi:hypothetical protein
LIAIILEDDFAWPKTMDSDYFYSIDPKSHETARVWSPVRAYALLMKTHLPVRTFQVRVLNSGEADAMVYRPADGTWISNPHPLAGTASPP